MAVELPPQHPFVHGEASPFCPRFPRILGQPPPANPFEEHRNTTNVSLSSPKARRPGARIVPAERTGDSSCAVHCTLAVDIHGMNQAGIVAEIDQMSSSPMTGVDSTGPAAGYCQRILWLLPSTQTSIPRGCCPRCNWPTPT